MLRVAVIAGLIMLAGAVHADSVKRVRFTDSSGQAHIVDSINNVPKEYLGSASDVLVHLPSKEEKLEEKPGAVNKPSQSSPVAGTEQTKPASASKEDPGASERTAEMLAKVNSALVITKKIDVGPLKFKWVVFTGQVKNQHDDPLSGVKITINVINKKGDELPPVVSPISGKSGESIIAPGETVDINVITSIPPDRLAGFTYHLAWDVETKGR